MTFLLLYKIITLFIITFLMDFLPALTLIYYFQLKVKKRTALLFAFSISFVNMLLTMISIVLIGGGIIPETNTVLIVNKVFLIAYQVFIILFVYFSFEHPWYKLYCTIFVLQIVYVIPLFYYQIHFLFYQNNFLVLQELNSTNWVYYLISVALILLIALTLFLLQRFFHISRFTEYIPQIVWYLIIVLIGFNILSARRNFTLANEHASNSNPNQFTTFLTISFILTLLLAVFAIIYTNLKLLKSENELLKSQLELQYQSFISTKKQEEEIHKLYHDIGNHVLTIQMLLENQSTKEAKHYAANLQKEYLSISKHSYCVNKIINAVLLHKFELCRQNNISIEYELQIPELTIRDIDLMCIFSNLMDNAIESCQRNNSEQNKINLDAKVIGNYLTIKLINSKNSSVYSNHNTFNTWKNNKHLHGLGLKKIRDIANQYHGHCEFNDNSTEFISVIILQTDIISNFIL